MSRRSTWSLAAVAASGLVLALVLLGHVSTEQAGTAARRGAAEPEGGDSPVGAPRAIHAQTFDRGGRRVSGRVLGILMKPLEGAAVASGDARTTSGPDGAFVLQDGGEDLRVEHTGYRRKEAVLPPGARELGDIVLDAEFALIEGMVRRADGTPVRSAEITVYARLPGEDHRAPVDLALGGPFAPDPPLGETASDSSGVFRFESPPFRQLVLSAREVGSGQCALAVRTEESGGLVRVILTLAPSCTLRGRVVDEDGVPVSGIAITAQPNPDSPDPVIDAMVLSRRCAVSDLQGGFELEDVIEGTLILCAGSDGARTVVAVSTPFPKDVIVVRRRGEPLVGTVVEEETGLPIAGARVECLSAVEGGAVAGTTLSDATGGFIMQHVPLGCPLDVSITKESHSTWSQRLPAGLGESSSKHESLRVSLKRENPREIEVVDTRGRFLPFVGIRLESPGIRTTHALRTDATGTSSVAGLAPGSYRVRIEDTATGLVPAEGAMFIEVTADVAPRLRVVLDQAVRLEGRARTSQGLAVPDLEVVVTGMSDGLALFEGRGATDAEGAFRVGPLERAGTYLVRAADPQRGRGSLELPCGPGAELACPDLVLEPTVCVRGEVRSEEGARICGATVRVHARGEGGANPLETAQTGIDGGFQFESLPAGALELRAVTASGIHSRSKVLRLVPGGRAENVIVTVPSQARIEGRTIDAGGGRIAGAVIRAQWGDPVACEDDLPTSASMQRTLIANSAVATSDRDGRFVFESVPRDASVLLVAHAEGCGTARKTAVAFGNTLLVLQLK